MQKMDIFFFFFKCYNKIKYFFSRFNANNFFWWIVFIIYSILFKWILLISASEWKKNVIRKNFHANESICINLRYLFDCISVDKWHNRKNWNESDFFRSFFYMCSWKVLVLDETTIVKDIKIVSDTADDWPEGKKNSHLVISSFFDMNFRRMKCIIVVAVIQLLKIWRSFFQELRPTSLRLNMNWTEIAMFSIKLFFGQSFNYIL